ncbi:MAG: transporter substrate-binding domain-containing protein [Verrucomicrobiaceae bacterium]
MRYLLALLLLLTACSKRDVIVIGMDATYPPFEFVDEKGLISGVSVEIGREIGKTAGKEVEFRNINFDGLITALRTGSIDFVISSMTANDERRKSIDFSEPYVKTGLAILAGKDASVQSVTDLQAPGRKVVVRLGTTGESWARQNLPKAEIKVLDLDTSCVMEVVNGNVDAWIYDQLSIMNYQAKHPEKTRALLAPLREESWAVGLRQGDEAKKSIVNETLARMRNDGSFARLADQFMAKERDMMKQQGLPFVFELP